MKPAQQEAPARRSVRVVVIAGAVLLGALAAGGVAYAAAPPDDSADGSYAVIDRSPGSGAGIVPAQGGTGTDGTGPDCPPGSGAAPQTSGASGRL